MKTVIISAFTPFGAYPVNSSEIVVRQLAQKGVKGFRIITTVFNALIPKEDRGEMLVRHAQTFKASGIISLGMASEKKGLCIEAVARNEVRNTKYGPPELQHTSIDLREAYGRQIPLHLVPWNIPAFQTACEAKSIKVERSNNAGGFCCNHLAYQTRSAIIKYGDYTPYLFIHLPCCPWAIPDRDAFLAEGKVSMSVEKMVQGIELLLQHASI